MTWHNTKEIGWHTIKEIEWHSIQEIRWHKTEEIRHNDVKAVFSLPAQGTRASVFNAAIGSVCKISLFSSENNYYQPIELYLSRQNTAGSTPLIIRTGKTIHLHSDDIAFSADANGDIWLEKVAFSTGRAITVKKLEILNGNCTFLSGATTSAGVGADQSTRDTGYFNPGTGGIYYSGNVGIGTTSPGYKLDVAGAINATALKINGVDVGTNGGVSSASSETFNSNSDGSGSDGGFNFQANATNLMTISNAGIVNVTATTASTSSSTGALTVAGGIGAAGNIYSGGVVATGSGTQALPSHTFTSDTASGMWSPASSAVAFSTNATEKMRITSAGNVGIGTTNPVYKLEVQGTVKVGSGNAQRFYNSAETNWATIIAKSISTGTAADLSLSTGGVPDALFIQNNGNVGIGTTAPTAKLNLAAGSAAAGTAPLKFTSGPLLGTAEDGAMEYNSGTGLWFTIGATRYVIPTNTAAGNYSNVSTIGNASGSITMTPMAGNSVVVNSATVSTTPTSGALIVSGGVGVSGDINTTGNMTLGGSLTATTNAVIPQIYGSQAASGNIKIDGTSNATKGNVLLATAGGNVGIGTPAPSYPLHVATTATSTTNFVSQPATYSITTANPAADSGAYFMGSFNTASTTANAINYTGKIDGTYSWAIHSSSGTLAYLNGVEAVATVAAGAGAVTNVYGVSGVASNVSATTQPGITGTTGIARHGSAGILTAAYGVSGLPQNSSTGAITKAVGFYAKTNNNSTGTIGTSYGIYLDSPYDPGAGIATNYGVYQVGSTVLNSFAGNVGIGTTAPTAPLDVAGSISSRSGAVRSGQYGQYTSTNTSIFNDAGASYGITFSTNSIVRAIIDGAGNVGIGTTAPGAALDVAGGTMTMVLGQDNGATTRTTGLLKVARVGTYPYTNTDIPTALIMGQSDAAGSGIVQMGGGSASMNAARLLMFYTGAASTPTGSERMRIDSFGNVGIGTTAPGAKLEVNSGAAGATTGINISTTTAGANTYEQYKANGAVIGSITSAAGANVAFNTTSDVRLKGGFQPVLSPLKALNKIEVSNFYYLADPEQTRMDGFKAQQLYTVAPYAVTKPAKDVDENGKIVPWLVDYSKVVPLVTAAVQELYHEVFGLKGDVITLKSQNTAQSREIASVNASKADKTEVDSIKAENLKLKQENAAKAKELDAIKAYLCAKDPKAPICH